MTRRPSWLSAAAIGGAIALLAGSAAPVFAQGAPELPPEGGYNVYPDYAEVDCEAGEFNGSEYTGQIKQIEALDDYTVQFTLCQPDGGAFLSKIAFSAFGIQDADYLRENAGTGVLRDQPNGTGPYKLGEWRRGEEVIFVANEDYWGEAPLTPTAVLRWSSEPGQKLIELQSGNADAIDNPSVDDLPAIEADENLDLLPRGATNIFYLGMTNFFEPWSNQKIRQGVALGIDRQQIVDQFYPPGSKVPDFFTPCEIPFACEGDPWPAFDPEAGRALIAEGLAELGLEEFPEVPIRLRVVDRSYLPFPEQVAVELQNQLQENLGIPTVVEVKESGTFINDSQSGREEGFWLLGWNADYPEVTNFLDFHFGAGAGPSFGELWPEITEPLLVGSTSADPEVRAQAYTEANNAIREIVPMVPIATGNSFTAWAKGIEGAQSSPISNEQFAFVDTGDDDFVFVQNEEPISLYCADESDGESLRACEQINESLYGFEINGTAPVPLLAEVCEPNETLDVWTCKLREGVTFHNGADFTAHDVVTTYAHFLDSLSPMHDPLSSLYYYTSLWNGFLNGAAASE